MAASGGAPRPSAGGSTSTTKNLRTPSRTAPPAHTASSTRTKSARTVSGAAASPAAQLAQGTFRHEGGVMATEELHELRPGRIREILDAPVYQPQRLRR